MRRLIILAACAALAGCATANVMQKVQLGMSKDQVVTAIGKPASVSAQGNTEYLTYRLSETDDEAFLGILRPYYVRLVNGQVESFGRTGDFDSTKVPTARIETDSTMRDKNVDNYDRLIKLNELRKAGAITDEEYQKEKARLLP